MEIISYQSFGPVAFGDSRAEARKKFAVPFEPFKKGQEEVDLFKSLLINVHYDGNGRVEFVEAGGNADVTFRGVRFLNRPVREILKDMAALGFTPAPDDDDPTFLEAGVSVYAPGGRVQGVSAFKRGYYDGLQDAFNDLLDNPENDDDDDLLGEFASRLK